MYTGTSHGTSQWIAMHFDIPDGTTCVDEGSWKQWGVARCKLTSVTAPGSLTAIGQGGFRCCVSLVAVKIPGAVTVIGRYGFDGCASLAAVAGDPPGLCGNGI